MVRINGENVNAAGMTILDYLLSVGFDPQKVVVEVNLDIIPREAYAAVTLKDEDSVEVLRFVGGG